MAKVLFTPWKEHSQLLTVRSQFYPPPTYDGPDMRSRASATVSIWKVRGNLPHAVEATALLTDAILHDDAQKNSIFSIRATYSAAFCRFVTGLVDSKLHGQRRTMFQRAMDLGLPASFVELRHEATHRELPSLTVLRNATQRSLEWLWDFYWAKTDLSTVLFAGSASVDLVDCEGEGEGEEAALEAAKALVRDMLYPLLGGDQEDGETTATGEQPPRKKRKMQVQQQVSVAGQLVATCKSCGKGDVALSRVLLEESAGLVPAGRRKGDSLAAEFTKWDRFLQTIAEGYPGFLSSLTEVMVDEIAFHAQTKGEDDARSEGIYLWLDHILGSTGWASRRQLLSCAYLRSVCEGTSNRWTAQLKKTLDKSTVDDVLLRSAGLDAMQTETLGAKVEVESEDVRVLKNFGWDVMETWDSRPLGVA